MVNPPRTIKEARKIRYGKSGLNPSGVPYREGYCAQEVGEPGRAIRFYQCQRKAVVGLFCRQHDPAAVAKREKERTARWRQEQANSPHARADRYRKALERIARMYDASMMVETALDALRRR